MKDEKMEILELSIQDSTKNKIKNILSIIIQLLGITGTMLTAVLILYQFGIYLYDMQIFNYWNIDLSFYKTDSQIINSLLYSFFIICWGILLSLSIPKKSDKKIIVIDQVKDWIWYLLLYIIFYALLSTNYFYRYGINLCTICFMLIGAGITFILIKFFSNKIFMCLHAIKYKKFYLLSDIFFHILIGVISVFISIIIYGNLRPNFAKEYRIIEIDNSCKVILYSCDEYYVIADCKKNGKTLSIYKNTNRKIDNYEIMSKWEQFEKIEKIDS